ncbi:putative uncharacterized protein C8orf44 [Plecturocebus cupreus]
MPSTLLGDSEIPSTACILQLFKILIGWAQQLMPVIPAFREAKADGPPEVTSSRPTWPTWQNPISANTEKLAGHGGRHL